MSSVTNSWAVLRGRQMGNPQQAQGLLDSLQPAEMAERNRQESRSRVDYRKRFKSMRARYGRS